MVEPMIARALKRTKIDALYRTEDILFSIALQEYHLWIVHKETQIDACLVTRINQYPRMKTCAVFIVAGSGMRDWLPIAQQKIEAYAKQAGCKWMEGGGREGWVRAAGYEKKGVVLIKDIDNG